VVFGAGAGVGWALAILALAGIREKLPAVMEEATLSEVDRRLLSQRMFLNPAVFESVD
jgi:Na+-transporting NADH:ubiquinone oxidoreductase subunit NqrE